MTPPRKKATSKKKAAAKTETATPPPARKAASKKSSSQKSGERKAAARKGKARDGAARAQGGDGSPKSHLGAKYLCFHCGAKFYDLNRPEPLCPKCGTDQRRRPKTAPASTAAASLPRAERPDRRLAMLEEEESSPPDQEEDGDLILEGEEELDLDLDEADGILEAEEPEEEET